MTHEDAMELTQAVKELTRQLHTTTDQFKQMSSLNDFYKENGHRNIEDQKNNLRFDIHHQIKLLKRLNGIPIIHNQLWELINRLDVFTHIIPLGNGTTKEPLDSLVHHDDSTMTYCKYMMPYIDSSNKHLVTVKSLLQIRNSLHSIIPKI